MNQGDYHEITVANNRPALRFIAGAVYSQAESRGFENVALHMDIIKPVSAKRLPAVLYITGGGYIHSNRGSFLPQRMDLANAGYVVASMEYRTAPAAVFPAQIRDVKAAIRYLRASAEKYSIDPSRIALLGASAGGHLAALAGASNSTREFDAGDNIDHDSRVQAVVDFYGTSDLMRLAEDEQHASASAPGSLFLNGVAKLAEGRSLVETPERAEKANPVAYIDEQTPPFLFMHGEKDTTVPSSQTRLLHSALLEKGISSTYYLVKGAGHGSSPEWCQTGIMDIVIAFLNRQLS